MTQENDYDPFESLLYDRETERANHRRSRKANRKAKIRLRNHSGALLPLKAKRFGKKVLHRFNRRNWEVPYHKVKGNFGQILWDMT